MGFYGNLNKFLLANEAFTLFLALLLFSNISCGYRFYESTHIKYEPTEHHLDDFDVEFLLRSYIEPTQIQPLGYRRFFHKIPGVGNLLLIPLNLVESLIPNLPKNDSFELPPEASLDDPEIQALVTAIELEEIYFRSSPTKEAPEEGRLSFIKTIKIYIVEKNNPSNTFLIASADRKNDLSPDETRWNLVPTSKLNLKPFLQNLNNFEVQTAFEGKPPRHEVRIDGSLLLRVKLKI